MNTPAFMATLLAGAVGVSPLVAGEQRQPVRAERTEVSQAQEGMTGARLATLEARCKKMSELQAAVNEGTRGLSKIIEGHADRKPRAEDKLIAVELSKKQMVISAEATKAIAILKAEAAAVALLEVFESLRDDMKRVQVCLEKGDVGSATQAVEQDILDTLQEMITPFR